MTNLLINREYFLIYYTESLYTGLDLKVKFFFRKHTHTVTAKVIGIVDCVKRITSHIIDVP